MISQHPREIRLIQQDLDEAAARVAKLEKELWEARDLVSNFYKERESHPEAFAFTRRQYLGDFLYTKLVEELDVAHIRLLKLGPLSQRFDVVLKDGRKVQDTSPYVLMSRMAMPRLVTIQSLWEACKKANHQTKSVQPVLSFVTLLLSAVDFETLIEECPSYDWDDFHRDPMILVRDLLPVLREKMESILNLDTVEREVSM